MRDISPCSDLYHETMTTEGAWFIPNNGACLLHDGYITMLWPLSWDDDNWWSMIHTWGIYNNALSVVMRRSQLTEHVLYMNDILQSSDRCYETMTTDGACFILEGYITMLWPLSWDDDNWRSMIHTLGIYYQALTVVFIRWQLTEHGSYPWDILPYSDRCHETMTIDGAWFIPKGYITMLRPLSFNDDNWRSMLHTWGIYNHALSVVMRRWQLTKHIYTCMIYHHALTVVMRRWKLTEHD